MKKSKKKIWLRVAAIFMWLMTISFISESFQRIVSDFSGAIIGLVFAAIFALVGWLLFKATLSKKKNVTQASPVKNAPASSQMVTQPSPMNQPQAQQPVPAAAPKMIRSEYLAKKIAAFAEELDSIPREEIILSDSAVARKPVSDMPEIKYSNITRRTVIDKLFPLVVLDTETTGLSPSRDEIIEVSAIKFGVDFVPVSCFTTLLRPKKPIPAEASAINHITDEMVDDCPSFSQVADGFSTFISGCTVVGHNLPFDLKFLYANGIALSEKARYIDSLSIAKHTLKSASAKVWDNENKCYVECEESDVPNYKLESLCDYYGIIRDDAHRSLSDCLATAKVLEHLIEDKTAVE